MKKRRHEMKIRARQRRETHERRLHGNEPRQENRFAWKNRRISSLFSSVPAQFLEEIAGAVRINYQ